MPYTAYYTHSHTSVVINSLQTVANITRVQPQKTQKYVNESKISSSSKKGSTFSAARLVSAILPQLTFGGNASRIAEQTTSSDKTQKSARIRQTAIRGVARWGFYNADDFDQDGGKVVSMSCPLFTSTSLDGLTPPHHLPNASTSRSQHFIHYILVVTLKPLHARHSNSPTFSSWEEDHHT